MLIRLLVILIIFNACQTGKIPCPDFKADRVKRSHVKKQRHYDRNNTTASARVVETAEDPKPVKTDYQRGSEIKPPALERVDVEEWDCPKPGTTKKLPKALKDNIRKNKKAYESYYRNRQDSLQSVRKTDIR